MAKPMRATREAERHEDGERSSQVWTVESGEVAAGPAAFALHDAKNLIAVLKASLHYLSEEIGDSPRSADVASALEDARSSADRMAELLCEALVALRGRTPQKALPHALRVAPVIGALVQRIAPMASRRGVRLVAAGAEDARALIDHGLFERAALNFIDNALRYSKPGDTIEIEYLAHGGRVVVAFADQGPGISEDMRDAVFESDRKQQASGPGNFGLGLAFCREVAKAHGGGAWVFNRTGGGACFVFEVAAAPEGG
jgi:two-component system sensor histidine kinase CreC